MKIKICGITEPEDALCAQDAGADMIGLVFADSPRRIGIDQANRIISSVSSRPTPGKGASPANPAPGRTMF